MSRYAGLQSDSRVRFEGASGGPVGFRLTLTGVVGKKEPDDEEPEDGEGPRTLLDDDKGEFGNRDASLCNVPWDWNKREKNI